MHSTTQRGLDALRESLTGLDAEIQALTVERDQVKAALAAFPLPLPSERMDRQERAAAAPRGNRQPPRRNGDGPTRSEQIQALLRERGELTRNEIGDAIGVTSKNAATLVGTMRTKGLVKVVPSKVAGEADRIALAG